MDYAQLGAVSIHTLAMILVVGYYGILGRVILPGLRRSLDEATQAPVLAAIERRAAPLIVLAVGLFVATGVYLLVVDDQYAGLGDFSSTWAALMLVKHLLVIVMVVLGFLVDYLIRGLVDADAAGREGDMALLGLATEGATGLGAAIVVLTAAAQLS